MIFLFISFSRYCISFSFPSIPYLMDFSLFFYFSLCTYIHAAFVEFILGVHKICEYVQFVQVSTLES